MSEELLKAIIQLFAIVAKERVTEDERSNIKEFLSVHLNQESVKSYLQLFDQYSQEEIEVKPEIEDADEETIEFIDEWSKIIEISKRINQGLSQQQKVILIIKMIELIWANRDISERQSNLIFYIGKAIKIDKKVIDSIKSFVISQDIEEMSYPNILIIDEGSGDHPYRSKHMVSKELTGLISILRLSEMETYFIKYIGITSLTLNGLPLNSRKIYIFPAGSIDQIVAGRILPIPG